MGAMAGIPPGGGTYLEDAPPLRAASGLPRNGRILSQP